MAMRAIIGTLGYVRRGGDGPLGWFPITELGSLPMWEGDRHFLPLVFDDDPRQFHAVLPYRDGALLTDRIAIWEH